MKEFIVCELLGMSANTPTDLCFSFTGLTRRGGETGPHKDGWGMAFYEGKGVRLFHDPEPCATSKIAEFVSHLPIKSRTAICHIRQANVGNINLANTHPFTREMWGKYWVFAHNGQLPNFVPQEGMYRQRSHVLRLNESGASAFTPGCHAATIGRCVSGHC